MPLAIFGIENTAISLAVTFVILGLFAIWIALIVFTFSDARRRISDPFLIACATAASFFPFVGTVIYSILRPPEFLDDVAERETEMKSSETRLRHLDAHSCRKCGFPTEADFVRCPACRSRLKDPCPSCDRPVGLKWKVCPYCEQTLIESKRSRSRAKEQAKEAGRDRDSGPERQPRASAETDQKAKPEQSGSSSRKSGRRAARTGSPSAQSSGDRGGSSDRGGSPGSGSPAESSARGSSSKPADSADRPARSATRRRTVVTDDDLPPTRTINGGNADRTGGSADSD